MIVEPCPEGSRHLKAYFERLLDRTTVKRVIKEARPYFEHFPYVDRMPARFRQDAAPPDAPGAIIG